MTLRQDQIDRIRLLYDTTACSMERIARREGISPATVEKYIRRRELKPSPPCAPSARWTGPNNSSENRGP